MARYIDAEIVKALEICTDKLTISCPDDCPFYDECDNDICALERQALALIKRKDAYIEDLKRANKEMFDRANELYKEIEKLKRELVSADEVIGFREAEIERLKEYESALKKGCALSKCINKPDLQREAYEELAENVYKFLCKKKNWEDFKEQWLENGECEWLKKTLSNIVNATWGGVRNGQDNEGSST